MRKGPLNVKKYICGKYSLTNRTQRLFYFHAKMHIFNYGVCHIMYVMLELCINVPQLALLKKKTILPVFDKFHFVTAV